MIPLERARELALALVPTLPARTVALAQAHRRFLAEPLVVTRPVPPGDSSAMDGWAIRSQDTRGAGPDRPVALRRVGVAVAGALPLSAVGPGETIRIFTGAPIPPGADAVVRQEEAEELPGGEIQVRAPAGPGQHVRREGEELEQGAVALPARTRLDAFALGVAASLGRVDLLVSAQPRVAVITVGDELIRPGRPALPFQVYDSSGTMLATRAAELGAAIASQMHAADDDAPIRAELEMALDVADLVVTCGGASVGDRDRVKHVLAAMGARFEVDGLLLKPGKPAAVASVLDKPVLVLPGNPGAAAVAFDQLGRPMLHRFQGVREVRRRIAVRLDAPRRKQAAVEQFLSAHLERGAGTGPPQVVIRPQGAGQILHLVGAEGWVILPRGREDFAAGEEHPMELFAGSVFE